MWSFNLVLTPIDPIPPKLHVGLRPTRLIPFGAVAVMGKGRQSCSLLVDISQPNTFGELAGAGAMLFRVACLDKGLSCGRSLGLMRSGVEMVASPILCLTRADNLVAGGK